MLDLTLHNFENYKIKMFDGEELEIKYPSQALFKEIAEIQNASDSEKVSAIYDVLYKILNLNINGKKFTMEEVADFDFRIAIAIITDYFNEIGDNLKK